MAVQLYRGSTVGSALTDVLDEMVTEGLISPAVAMKVLTQFDKAMSEALAGSVQSSASIKGHLHTYRFCDNVWTFFLENASFTISLGSGSETIAVDKAKIVAVASAP